MRPRPLQPPVVVFLVLAAGTVLACGLSIAGTPAPAVDATKIALQLKATALSLQLTQAALNAQPLAQSTPLSTAQVAPSEPEVATATSSATPTTAPIKVPLEYGAVELAYGDKSSNYPRKSEGTTYGFYGAQGDVVTVVLASSNARPKDSRCKDWIATTTFTLRTPRGQVPATIESAHLSSLRDYELPGSGAYYIMATCSGSGCNGYCTEADLSLEKQE